MREKATRLEPLLRCNLIHVCHGDRYRWWQLEHVLVHHYSFVQLFVRSMSLDGAIADV